MEDPNESTKPTRRRTPDATALKFRYGSKSGVEIKVCVRTYRLFFEIGGEDWFYRKRSSDDENELVKKNEERELVRVGRMKEWVTQQLETRENGKPTVSNGSSVRPASVDAHTPIENGGKVDSATTAKTTAAGSSTPDVEMKEDA